MIDWRHRLDHAFRMAGCGLCVALLGLSCILVTIAVFPAIGLTSPDRGTTTRRVRRCLHHYYRGFLGMASLLGVISFEVHGGERLKAPGTLVVANHPSLLDVLFIGAQMPNVDCIVKDAVLHNPLLRASVQWADYIPNGSPETLIGSCVAALHEGNSLLIFPEGTRSVPDRPLTLKRGAAHVALEAGCDLLPVTIQCSRSSWSKGDEWYRAPRDRPHWVLTVGDPIRVSELVVAGEPKARSVRRVTAHLADYFDARLTPSRASAAAVEVPSSAPAAGPATVS